MCNKIKHWRVFILGLAVYIVLYMMLSLKLFTYIPHGKRSHKFTKRPGALELSHNVLEDQNMLYNLPTRSEAMNQIIITYTKANKAVRIPVQDGQFEDVVSRAVAIDNSNTTPDYWTRSYRDKGHNGVWPLTDETNDRITEQMSLSTVTSETKLIILWDDFSFNDVEPGQESQLLNGCAVDNCKLIRDKSLGPSADVVISAWDFKDYHRQFPELEYSKSIDQILVWFQLESPPNTTPGHIKVNWTATYRKDSTLTTPYYKLQTSSKQTNVTSNVNYAKGKSKMVAWFVSNCDARNGRIQYAHAIQKHVPVDIYGRCGPLQCNSSPHHKCFDMLNADYKFYLSFENSNCREYITEKFFRQGLLNNIVPVVMGARREDYAAVAPPHSFIHVDDFESPRHLAEYLIKLDNNDTLYNEYFEWKGSGEFINTKFWCRLCAMVHEAHATGVHMWYDDLGKWWKGEESSECLSRGISEPWVSWRNSGDNNPRNNSNVHIVRDTLPKPHHI